MKVRNLIPGDIPILKAMQGDFPYPDLEGEEWTYGGPRPPREPQLEAMRVVVDDDDKPLMAVAAKRLIELYLWCGEIEKPLAKMYALRLLHDDMAKELRKLGYNSVEAFLPPPVAKRFARRLQKSFGWRLNPWSSLTKDI